MDNSNLLLTLSFLAGFVIAALVFGFMLMIKQDAINHMRELIRLDLTQGGTVRVTQAEADSIIKDVLPADYKTYKDARKTFDVQIINTPAGLIGVPHLKPRTI